MFQIARSLDLVLKQEPEIVNWKMTVQNKFQRTENAELKNGRRNSMAGKNIITMDGAD